VIGALAFLTIFGRARSPSPKHLVWFPVVGALIGAAVGGVWAVGDRFWPGAVAAMLAVVADLVITGLLHMDGVADSADGLLPHLTRERRLEVMATPGVGAFAVTTVAATVLLRWAALAALASCIGSRGHVVVGVAALWALSRGLMAAAIAVMPYARPGGLAAAYGGRSPSRAAVVAVVSLALATTGVGLARCVVVGVAAVVASVAAGSAVLWLGRRRLGGYTGDVLGAAGVIAEIAGLLVLAARY
jgi:adenosylcobinamide-GDP ribazoletransferase